MIEQAMTVTLLSCFWSAGVVNGVQNSLQNLFQSLSYVAGLILWRPQEFPTLMYLSTAVVAAAACVFSLFACVGASGPHRS